MNVPCEIPWFMHLSIHMCSLWVYHLCTMESPVRVLFIEASADAAAPIVASLAASDRASFEVALVPGVPDAQRRCMTQTFDLVLAGAALEDPRDLEPLRLLSVQLASSAPLVLLA